MDWRTAMHEIRATDGGIVTVERITRSLWRLTFEDGHSFDLSTKAAETMRHTLHNSGWSE
jgi:hypothetical protein